MSAANNFFQAEKNCKQSEKNSEHNDKRPFAAAHLNAPVQFGGIDFCKAVCKQEAKRAFKQIRFREAVDIFSETPRCLEVDTAENPVSGRRDKNEHKNNQR